MKAWLTGYLLTWRSLALFMVALAFWKVLIPFIGPHVIPAEWYLDVKSVYVEDSRGGKVPAVTVDRSINAHFNGAYTATLRRVDEGVLWTYCPPSTRPDIEFRKGAPYPGRDLSWWLGTPPADQCRLVPGKYSLRLQWEIPALWGLVKLPLVRNSPIFSVFDDVPAPIED